jgi:hypothetical protein
VSLILGLAVIVPRVAGSGRIELAPIPAGTCCSRTSDVLTPPTPPPVSPTRLSTEALASIDRTLSEDRRPVLHSVCPVELPRLLVPVGPDLLDPPVDWPSLVELAPRRAPRAPPRV